jgi:hypothetical protein
VCSVDVVQPALKVIDITGLPGAVGDYAKRNMISRDWEVEHRRRVGTRFSVL